MARRIAGIDIHKNVLMAVVATVVEKEIDGGLEQQIGRSNMKAAGLAPARGRGGIWLPGCGNGARKKW
jgi:hypothetical protein